MDLVVDCGSSSVKAGYSGDDSPSCIFPSVIPSSCTNINNSLHKEAIEYSPYEKFSYVHPIQRGRVNDWEAMHKLWATVEEQMGVNTADLNSILIVESPLPSVSLDRKEWAALLFEGLQAQSVCVMNSAPLTLFASGRTTGVSLDIGAGFTSVVPVYEGLPLAHASLFMDYGGQDISLTLHSILRKRSQDIEFGYSRSLKEKMAFVVPSRVNKRPPVKVVTSTCFLPDGTEISVENSVFSECTEGLLKNSTSFPFGVVEQLFDSLSLCEYSLRTDLAMNIILAGGTSILPGLGDRINEELMYRFNGEETEPEVTLDVRVVPSTSYIESGYTSQRKVAAWIGGSIISSLDSYKSLRVSREEWEEVGENCLGKHCL